MLEIGSESLGDEWQSVSEITSTCYSIVESLSRRDSPSQRVDTSREPEGRCWARAWEAVREDVAPRDNAQEATGELTEETDRAALEEKVQRQRHNHQRLQA